MTGLTILDTDAFPSGFNYSSLVVAAGATLRANGSNPLVISVRGVADIQGTIDVSGGKGGNSAGDHMSAAGGAGGGALKIVAAQITIGASGSVHADGGDGGDAGGPGQGHASASWFTVGDGAPGAGVAGGHDGGAGAGSGSAGNAGNGPGASPGGDYSSGVPPGAGGAGHALAGASGFGEYSGLTPAGGPAYGDTELSDGLQGGSGAGGGANDPDNEEGAGGGGSGGTIFLVAGVLQIEGNLSAAGGLGGRDDYQYTEGDDRECCNNGGPGSVGRIRLDYETLSQAAGASVTPAPGFVREVGPGQICLPAPSPPPPPPPPLATTVSYTGCNSWVGKNIAYFDRHNPQCQSNEYSGDAPAARQQWT